ncbi:hypothetical protein AYO38_06020 [bacterium SCGC AG-212-C10]|nr:hypothetical protein AYO38_06020 [bacterium SCGC AG-212-C10]
MPPFLTAQWRHLLMANYAVDPVVLKGLLPRGVELDSYDGVHYVSVVGFLFLDTKVLGVPIPFHRDFEEVNLRFYVKRTEDGVVRRGVVFVREIVPKRAIATVARVVYGERYVAKRMTHRVDRDDDGVLIDRAKVAYGWKSSGRWESTSGQVAGGPTLPAQASLEAFITEHYWGYARQRDGGTVEYEVRHPRWNVWRVEDAALRADIGRLYGHAFNRALSEPPASVFLADGSAVSVHRGRRLPDSERGSA